MPFQPRPETMAGGILVVLKASFLHNLRSWNTVGVRPLQLNESLSCAPYDVLVSCTLLKGAHISIGISKTEHASYVILLTAHAILISAPCSVIQLITPHRSSGSFADFLNGFTL